MKLRKLLLPFLICWGLSAAAEAATPASLSELLEKVRRGQQQQELTNSQREQRFLAVLRALGIVAERCHCLHERIEKARIIVDDQDAGGHALHAGGMVRGGFPGSGEFRAPRPPPRPARRSGPTWLSVKLRPRLGRARSPSGPHSASR